MVGWPFAPYLRSPSTPHLHPTLSPFFFFFFFSRCGQCAAPHAHRARLASRHAVRTRCDAGGTAVADGSGARRRPVPALPTSVATTTPPALAAARLAHGGGGGGRHSPPPLAGFRIVTAEARLARRASAGGGGGGGRGRGAVSGGGGGSVCGHPGRHGVRAGSCGPHRPAVAAAVAPARASPAAFVLAAAEAGGGASDPPHPHVIGAK